jgi:hypothetical protein
MAGFPDKLKDVLLAVAPTAATLLGGPFAGTAVTALARALGKPEGTTIEEMAPEIVAAHPDTLIKLKEAEIELKKLESEHEIQLVGKANEDRASARLREQSLRDWTPSVLAAVVTIGFFGVILWTLKWGLPADGLEVLLVLFGALSTKWSSIVDYYYGSSAGSARKQATIDTVMKGR